MTESVEVAVARCLARANQKFDAAIAALQPPPVEPPLTVMELWGRAARQLTAGFEEMGRQFRRGYEHG